MVVDVVRFEDGKDFTVGLLFIDGVFKCYTLEDEARTKKVYAETRIPAGKYRLALQAVGRMHESYKKKFTFHKGMIHVLSVPGFEGILLHIGNTDRDTTGCLLVGLSHTVGVNFIGNSTSAYAEVYPLIANAISSGKSVYLNIVDKVVDSDIKMS